VSIVVDVVVIGGGPAGLQAALVLGRARRSVVVIDEGRPRNRVTHASHGFLTRDGITPTEFRRIAKAEVLAYPSVQVRKEIATAVTVQDGAFTTTTDLGTVIQSKKLLFATGMKDAPPAIPGLAAVYGTSAFVCPYCDGWELRDQPLVLIAQGDRAYHMTKVLRAWTPEVTLCTNGPAELSEADQAELKEHRVPVYESLIAEIESEGGKVKAVRLADGSVLPCSGLFFAPVLVPATPLPETLGCALMPNGAIQVELSGGTTVPGVYAAGDAARERYQLIMAAADGALAAIAINSELIEADWNR
jgi:thioredoxin reductase